MYKLFVTICLISFTAFGAFAQTSDSTNANPDWVVKPKPQPQSQQQAPPQRPVTLEKPKPEWVQHLKYGGNFWLSVWNGAYIELSPMVGYKLNEKGTTAGIGLNMIYTNSQVITNTGQIGHESNFDYGVRAFIQQPIFNMFFLHGEIEAMNARSLSFFDPTGDPYSRKWEAYPLVGIGFYPGKLRGGGRMDNGGANYYISVLYNLAYPNSGYNGSTSLGGGVTLRVGFF